jgi:DNA-binding transcriptional MocR family regulator
LYFGKIRPRPIKTFDKKGLVLHCGSFSKCLAPGYRVGWVAPGRFKHAVERLKFMTSISTASLPQAAVAEYLKHGGYERHLRRLRQRLSAAMPAMAQAVAAYFPSGTRITRPGGGYMLWVELPKSIDSLLLHRMALAKNISLVPGSIFSARRKYNNCIRLNFGHPETKATRDAVRTLGGLCSDLVVAGR